MEHRKPKESSRKLDPAKQAAFINRYDELLNLLAADEAVMLAAGVHPTHAARPVGCWTPKEVPIAIPQTSGRDRLNIPRRDQSGDRLLAPGVPRVGPLLQDAELLLVGHGVSP
jgi:hypothetical protein